MSFKPPQSAINNAKRGLKLRQEWGRGGLSPAEAKAQGIDSGVTRARKISSGTVSEHDVRRMSAFNRHRKNYRPEKKMPDGGPTAGTIAWLLWGGTSGVNWAKKKSAAMNAESFASDEFTEEETLEELYEDYLEELDTYGHDGPVMSKSEYGRYLSDMEDKTFDAESEEEEDDEEEPELKKYMVSVPALHYYAIGPVEAYNKDEAEDEVVNNWRYWASTIDNNGDWGGPIWRYRGIDISEPEAYSLTQYEAEYKTLRKDEIGQLVNATKATLDALNDCLEEDGRFNEDEYDALWETHPILADLQSKRFEASGQLMPVGFEETDDYYEEGAHIIEAQIPFLAPKGYYISDIEFHDGRIEVIFISEDETFEADWRDLPRDSKGRWMSQGRPEEPKVSTYSRKPITLRELSEQLQQDLGLEDFNSAYFTVQQMLDAFPGGDSAEARRALMNTIEDTALVLQYNEEIDYPTHIQIMADIYRESGNMPVEEYEDAVFNRIAFEDEFAAERRVKPNLPRTSPDYTYSETFGKNIVLLSEDDEEGPTVEDFFREAEKLFNKYGEFSWDSEQHDDGLHISCFLVPWNGAYNFFQYDEDFSTMRDE